MDRLLSMRVFQRVVDEGGFAAAARALDMSPAGVTRLVSDLEKHLGVRLMQRSTRRITLTDEGQSYLNKVRHILFEIDEADADAQEHTLDISGVLRISAPPMIATHILAPVVAEFKRRYPRVLLNVSVDSQSEVSVEDFDLTLLSADDTFDANVVARPLITSHGIICASPDYLQHNGVPHTPAELSRHQCLRTKLSGRPTNLWQLFNPEDGDTSLMLTIEPAFLVNDADTLLSATLNGAGISGQPLDLVAAHLRNGQLTRILLPWITGRYTLFAVFPSRKFMPARVRVFLELITATVRASVDDAVHHLRLVRSGSDRPH